ncbi:MAG: hypothetical protein ACI9W2_000314 [Gammaproteobacteria bacterium]|jgi:hypothetical protein
MTFANGQKVISAWHIYLGAVCVDTSTVTTLEPTDPCAMTVAASPTHTLYVVPLKSTA